MTPQKALLVLFPFFIGFLQRILGISGNLINSGVYIVARLLINFPPCLWFPSPRRIASRYKIFDLLPLKAIKQYILGLDSVKLCCSICILPFSTTKSVKTSKFFFFLFFKLLIFFPIFKPFGGECSTLYTPGKTMFTDFWIN